MLPLAIEEKINWGAENQKLEDSEVFSSNDDWLEHIAGNTLKKKVLQAICDM